MSRIVLGLEYDGSAFLGWQSQPHRQTVQDVLEQALSEIAAERIVTHCAGRTDAGVHASVQIVHFDTAAVRPASAWVRGVNAFLPPAVAVRWAVEVDEGFHARFLAQSRHYRYVLYNAPVRPGLLAGRVGWFHLPLALEPMKEAARCLLGTHDFSSFRAAGCQAKTPVRHMHACTISQFGQYFLFDFHANGFLHHMIRNLVGALVYVGKGRHPPSWLAQLLEARSRTHAAPTFMPDGLYLCGVEYPANWPLPEQGRIISRPSLPLV